MRLQSAAIWLLVAYKRWLSPILPAACRFHPSCSEYARQAISMHGFGRGSWLAIRRLVRCQPFCRGGFDPVPCASKPHSSHGRCAG